MTPERILLAAMHNIIDTTVSKDMKKINDYLTLDTETFEHFAWLPKRMSCKKIVWFGKYVEVRHYVDLLAMYQLKNSYFSMYYTPTDHMIHVLKNKEQ